MQALPTSQQLSTMNKKQLNDVAVQAMAQLAVMQKWLEDKDKAMKDKDKWLEDKDKAMRERLEDKDKWLEDKDKAMRERLAEKDRELLQARGLFTARGFFEFATREAYKELKRGNIIRWNNFNASSTLEFLDTLQDDVKQKITDEAGDYEWCTNMLKSWEACSASGNHSRQPFRDIYRTLSQGIHGFPWYGESINISPMLGEFEKCFITSMAERSGWSWAVVTPPRSED